MYDACGGTLVSVFPKPCFFLAKRLLLDRGKPGLFTKSSADSPDNSGVVVGERPLILRTALEFSDA